MHVSTVSSAIHQFVTVNIWSEGGFRQRRSPSSTFFCPALDPRLGISGRNRYQNGYIPSKAFCLWSSLWLLLALPWIQPRADLIKSLNTCAGNENFIPTKFHKHPSSVSVVKADYVCSHIYIYIFFFFFFFFFKSLNNPLVSPHCFKFPLVHLCAWGNSLCFWTFSTAAHFVWKL